MNLASVFLHKRGKAKGDASRRLRRKNIDTTTKDVKEAGVGLTAMTDLAGGGIVTMMSQAYRVKK
jgi:hypothetical protein